MFKHLVVNGSLTSPAVTVQAGGLLREPLQFRPYPDRFGLAFLNDSIKNSKTQEAKNRAVRIRREMFGSS